MKNQLVHAVFVSFLALNPLSAIAWSVDCPYRAPTSGTMPSFANQAIEIESVPNGPLMDVSTAAGTIRLGYRQEAGFYVGFQHRGSGLPVAQVRVDPIAEVVMISRGVFGEVQAPITRTDCTFKK